MLFQERTTLLQGADKMKLFTSGKLKFLKDLWPDLRKDAVRCAPQFRINLRKDRVAQLNCFKFLKFLQRNLVGRFKATPDIQQCAELFQMSIEALLRVIAGCLSGDQKLPVRGFQQKQFAANLFYQPRGGFIVTPQTAVGHLLNCEFSSINMLPRPGRIFIQPYAIVALRSPRSFWQSHVRGWRKLVKVVGAGNELDSRFRLGKFQRHVLQPFRAFKPPMPKELGIKWRGQDGGSSAVF